MPRRKRRERGLENPLYVAMVLSILILLASMISVELGVTVAIVEIALGVVAGNVLGIDPPAWLDFLATFASVVLTFLAGAEVDPGLLRAKAKQSFLLGGVSFLAPFSPGASASWCSGGIFAPPSSAG